MTPGTTLARPSAGRPVLRGRPRDPGLRGRVHEAAIALLSEGGFQALTMERIARRAAVSRATLYGRWSCKEQLVVDAITRGIGSELPPAPDTGDVVEDLLVLLEALCAAMRGAPGQIIPPLVGELLHDPELASAFRNHFVNPRRARVREVIERGIAAGQLSAEVDVDLLVDVGAAVVFHRLLVTGEPLPDDLPSRVVLQLVGPWVRSPTTVSGERRHRPKGTQR